MKKLIAYEDPNHSGNSPKYHTGKSCITPGCDNPAGTAWSKLWCFKCNVKRIKGITDSLEEMDKDFEHKKNALDGIETYFKGGK